MVYGWYKCVCVCVYFRLYLYSLDVVFNRCNSRRAMVSNEEREENLEQR